MTSADSLSRVSRASCETRNDPCSCVKTSARLLQAIAALKSLSGMLRHARTISSRVDGADSVDLSRTGVMWLLIVEDGMTTGEAGTAAVSVEHVVAAAVAADSSSSTVASVLCGASGAGPPNGASTNSCTDIGDAVSSRGRVAGDLGASREPAAVPVKSSCLPVGASSLPLGSSSASTCPSPRTRCSLRRQAAVPIASTSPVAAIVATAVAAVAIVSPSATASAAVVVPRSMPCSATMREH